MRTYVDLAEGKLRALRALAERRGYRGYSRVLAEAVDEYLRHHAGDVAEDRLARIERLRGSLSEESYRHMKKVIRELRKEEA